MKLHDAADSGKIPSDLLPPEMQKSTPVTEDFSISVAGILKLLKNLKPGKAAGPDRLKPILLKELCEEIAPIIQVIFERSIQTGKLPAEWCRAQVSPIFKLEDLKVLRRSPDLLNNVKIGQGQLQLIMEQILFYHIGGLQTFWSSDLNNLMNNPSNSPVISEKQMFR